MHLVLVFGNVVGNRHHVVGAIGVVLERLLGEHVGDAMELLLLAERQFDRREPRTEGSPQCGDHRFEVGAMLVLPCDEHQAWQSASGALAPHRLGADLDAVGGADDEHRQVGDGEGRIDLGIEVGVPGRVDQVDAILTTVAGLPVERGDRQ